MIADPFERMRGSLTGLSVGDAFGQCFFSWGVATRCLATRTLPPVPWRWTDDTAMATSVVEILETSGRVDQDALARSFGDHFDPLRGYGAAMHRLLPSYAAGADWRLEAPRLFGGQGSYGNGAAMRVAPLGAFFAPDVERTAAEARSSAEVTHAHPEGIAGAIAIAAAAAAAAAGDPAALVDTVIEHTPASEVRNRLERIHEIPPDSSLAAVVAALGNGSRITAQDTVGFTVWAAAQHPDDYEAALWLTAEAGGDVDTTCAIVGGIVGARVGSRGIPDEWLQRREPLPSWTGAAARFL